MRREVFGVRLIQRSPHALKRLRPPSPALFVQRFDLAPNVVPIRRRVKSHGRAAALLDWSRPVPQNREHGATDRFFAARIRQRLPGAAANVSVGVGLREREQGRTSFRMQIRIEETVRRFSPHFRVGGTKQVDSFVFREYVESGKLLLRILGENIKWFRLVLRLGSVQLLDRMRDLPPKFYVILRNLRQHLFESRAGCRIAVESQAKRSIRGVELQPIQQQGKNARVSHAQARQQKGDVGALFLSQFLVETEQWFDSFFSERKQSLNQAVIHIVGCAADRVQEEIDGLRGTIVPEQVDQQRIEIDAMRFLRFSRERENICGGTLALIENGPKQPLIDADPAAGGRMQKIDDAIRL